MGGHLLDSCLVAREEGQVVEHEVAPTDAEDGPSIQVLSGPLHIRDCLSTKGLHLRVGPRLRVREKDESVLLVARIERLKVERDVNRTVAVRIERTVEVGGAGLVGRQAVAGRH